MLNYCLAFNILCFVIDVTRVLTNRNILSNTKFQNFKVNNFQNLHKISMYWLNVVTFLLGPAIVPRAQELKFTNTPESTNSDNIYKVP